MSHDNDNDTTTLRRTITIIGPDAYPTIHTDDGYTFYLVPDPDGTRVWADNVDPELRDITLDGDADLDLLYMN